MRSLAAIALVVVLSLTLTAGAMAGPSKGKPMKPAKVKVFSTGETFCPTSALVVGNVVITSGRCYVVYVLRDSRGTFLAFANPAGHIPPGQIVRLSTPAGAKVRGRIFYLVPIHPTAVIVPMNAVTLVPFRTEDFGPTLRLILTSPSAPNVSVTFEVRL